MQNCLDKSFESCDYTSRPLISQRFKIYEKNISHLNITIHGSRCFTYIDIIIRFMARAFLSSAQIIMCRVRSQFTIALFGYTKLSKN